MADGGRNDGGAPAERVQASSSPPGDQVFAAPRSTAGTAGGEVSALLPTLVTEAPGTVHVRSVILSGIFFLLLVFALDYAASVLIPLTLAVLLWLLLSPLVRVLGRARVTPALAAASIVLGVVGIVVAGFYQLAAPAKEWAQTLPWEMTKLEYRLRAMKAPLDELRSVSRKVESVTRLGADAATTTAVKVEPSQGLIELALSGTAELLAQIAVVLVVVFYLLASGDEFLRKLVRVLPSLGEKKRAVEAMREIERQISVHLTTITVINLALGVISAVMLWLLGVANPILWGTFIALANYAPYVGPLLSIALLFLVGQANFADPVMALAVPAGFAVLTTLEGQIFTPRLIGRELALSPLAVLLSLLFWGWLWGAPGVLMAVPILVCVRVLAEEIPPFRVIAEFLGA